MEKEKNKNFSVQLRAAGNDNQSYQSSKSSEIKQNISDYFKSEGFIENKRYPEQIISIFLSDDCAYAGLSQAEDNLSIWSGGMRHYAMREDTISRAEFKLLEALENYPIDFRENGIALDLGAAPGGWTKVLLEQGLRVVAVDPDTLSPVLQKNKDVEYYNGRVQDYIKQSNKIFDLIVNDMRMDIMTSVNLMLSLKEHLRDKGYFIITLKLKKHDRLKNIKDGLKRLRKELDVVYTKQLFHNRSEITVILQKN
jgi:23S rRNA (cytidine2498-2'-O)-methyltransferase